MISVGINAQETKPFIQSKLDGKVVDQVTNEPIIGASINIKGTTHSVISDAEGNFISRQGKNSLIH